MISVFSDSLISISSFYQHQKWSHKRIFLTMLYQYQYEYESPQQFEDDDSSTATADTKMTVVEETKVHSNDSYSDHSGESCSNQRKSEVFRNSDLVHIISRFL